MPEPSSASGVRRGGASHGRSLHGTSQNISRHTPTPPDQARRTPRSSETNISSLPEPASSPPQQSNYQLAHSSQGHLHTRGGASQGDVAEVNEGHPTTTTSQNRHASQAAPPSSSLPSTGHIEGIVPPATRGSEGPARNTPPYFLNALGYQFARINPNDHRACQRYILENPQILVVSQDLFLQEGRSALVNNQTLYARACLQRAVVLRQCKDLTHKGRREYFTDLLNEKELPIKSFYQTFDHVFAAVDTAAQAINTQVPARPRSGSNTTTTLGRAAQSSTQTRGNEAPNAAALFTRTFPRGTDLRRPEGPTGSNAYHQIVAMSQVDSHPDDDTEALAAAVDGLDILPSPPIYYEPTMPPLPEASQAPPVHPDNRHRPMLTTSPTAPGPTYNHPSSAGTISNLVRKHSSGRPAGSARKTQWSIDFENVEIKGSPNPKDEIEVDKLNHKYKKRDDAAKFFDVGRVFALLWHETAGNEKLAKEELQKAEDRLGPMISHSKGPYGEYIYSHIRRMVVVKHKHGYCWAIPINTYGKKGVSKPGFKTPEIEAHAIIHASNLKPFSLPTEKLIKDPIAVDMATQQTLDKMSRLHFAKVHTVEWNVKVMNIGKVVKDSMDKLISYWNNENNDQS